MGSAKGFMETERSENPFRMESERIADFKELHSFLPDRERKSQASRCMNCGVPFCQSDFGCPLHNLIPEWNTLLAAGQEKAALERLMMTAPFPEFTGHVCPALCEKACNLADGCVTGRPWDGVTNRDNELYLIEKGFEKGWIRPRMPAKRSGKTVMVVGSGPAGLAAADLLNRMGHRVTVIERADRAGGLLMYGIPNMKLPKETVQRRVRLMEAEGICFQLNTEANAETLKDADAVLLCGGARRPRGLNAEHMDAEGVMFAVDYLTEATRNLLERQKSGAAGMPDKQKVAADARGKHVVVVGGGDTGNDCVGTALRQGCLSVTQLEIMSMPTKTRLPGNPWPEWPRILRTDYGQQEAFFCQGSDPRIYETTVKQILTDGTGCVAALKTVRVRRGPEGGFEQVSGSEKVIPCELLLIAAGFAGCEEKTLDVFGLVADPRGRLMPENGSHLLKDRLFSAGDMRTGQSLVVRALADGRAAAMEIDAWLKEQG